MNISDILAQHYPNQVSQEDLVKAAQADWLVKAAAEQGLDLSGASNEQLEALYNDVFGKTAEGKDDDEDEEKKKVEEAKQEHEEKKASAQLLMEADAFGRMQARAYVDELNKIASVSTAAHSAKNAIMAAAEKVQNAGKRGVQLLGGGNEKIQGALNAAKKLESKATSSNQREFASKLVDKYEKLNKTEKHKVWGARGAAGLTAAGAVGLGAKAIHDHGAESSKHSSFEEVSAMVALEKAAAAGWDVEDCATRIASVIAQGGAQEQSKVAFVADFAQAVDMRALELLELGGYQVNWNY